MKDAIMVYSLEGCRFSYQGKIYVFTKDILEKSMVTPEGLRIIPADQFERIIHD